MGHGIGVRCKDILFRILFIQGKFAINFDLDFTIYIFWLFLPYFKLLDLILLNAKKMLKIRKFRSKASLFLVKNAESAFCTLQRVYKDRSVTSSNFHFALQHFHFITIFLQNMVDEKHSHTKFGMNWFIMARDMAA